MLKMVKHVDWPNWQPSYNNDSRPGLISDGTDEKSDSMMRSSYRFPEIKQIPHGKRKKLLKQFFWEQGMLQLVEDQKALEEVVEETDGKSEYMKQYDRQGFKSSELEALADPEFLSKYPLYTDPAKTIYLFNLHKLKGDKASKDLNAVFRRRNPAYDMPFE